MFVAIDEENKRVFGPFDSEAQGEGWCREYLRKVESHSWPHPDEDLSGDFDISFYLWNVQEVQFVDIEDTQFTAFLHNEYEAAGLARAKADAEANPGCICCQNNKFDPEHYHSPLCSPDFQEIEVIPDETNVYARSAEINPNAFRPQVASDLRRERSPLEGMIDRNPVDLGRVDD